MSSGGWRTRSCSVRGSGSHELAEARLNERVSAGLSDAIGRRDLAEPGLDRRGPMGARRADEGRPGGRRTGRSRELGVEVLDIRLRRFNHPVEVRPAVFELIRSERRQVAARLRAEGEAAVPDDHQPGRPDARHDPGRGRGRGPADPRQRRGRGDPRAQRSPRARPPVLRVPPHARCVSLDPRRPDDRRAVGVEPVAQAAVAGPAGGTGRVNLRRRSPPSGEGGAPAMKKPLAIHRGRNLPGRCAHRGGRVGAWSPLARSSWSGGWAGWSSRPGGLACTGGCRWESTGSSVFVPTPCGK